MLFKFIALAVYAGLIYLGASQPLTVAANLSIALLALVALAHFLECFLYRRLITEAPGSQSWHTVNVFLFGMFHMVAMRRAIRARYEGAS